MELQVWQGKSQEYPSKRPVVSVSMGYSWLSEVNVVAVKDEGDICVEGFVRGPTLMERMVPAAIGTAIGFFVKEIKLLLLSILHER